MCPKGQNRACMSRQDGILSKVGHIHKKIIIIFWSYTKHMFKKKKKSLGAYFCQNTFNREVKFCQKRPMVIFLGWYPTKNIFGFIWPKTSFFIMICKNMINFANIQHLGKSKKVGPGKVGAHFFPPIVKYHVQNICQNQIDRINFFVTHIRTSIHSYLHRTKKLQYNFISKLKS